MKFNKPKLGIFSILGVMLCLLCSCKTYDSSWNKIDIVSQGNTVATLGIPDKWKSEYRNNILYIFDDKNQVQLVQTDLWPDELDNSKTESNDVYQNLRGVSITSSATTSDSILFGSMTLSNGSEKFEKRWIRIDSTLEDLAPVVLLVWNDNISNSAFEKLVSSCELIF